ncbi:L-threonylcarbamoyladenylate synthase [Anaeromicropila populeti]|uniref:Threonylcarbamoyl-AMP synthase n=1 Tax=Anaeromicropila populeti TaxID=37658 RepID=A0A1I6I7W1_9FIRM|nr:L-threonylcarbamoyladenylate synthase [Anaeromicropila populeti]SFR62771.1 L-threonylcarbamoyladenylate synthase [Anaeromicropila populeti]
MITKYQVIKEEFKTLEFPEAARILQTGGLVAFPTETVYGLGGNALDARSAQKIYATKGRPSDNPLIIHIADMESLRELVKIVPPKAEKLAEAFWPGPLTMIFEKSDKVPYSTTGGLETVAVRMPSNPIALELIRESGIFIAAPSANTSGRPSPTTAEHVREDLDGKIEMIIDGGAVGIGIESTIVDLTAEVPVILRPGYVTVEMIKGVIGEIEVDKGILQQGVLEGIRPKAPGMKYKHYAPEGELTLFEGEEEDVIFEINQRTKELETKGKRVGVIATEESMNRYIGKNIKCIGSRLDEDSVARHLYAVLRDFDQEKVEYIFGECFSSEHFGQAIMNRLLKAAGYHVIQVSSRERCE